jgi:hypothetical protein
MQAVVAKYQPLLLHVVSICTVCAIFFLGIRVNIILEQIFLTVASN